MPSKSSLFIRSKKMPERGRKVNQDDGQETPDDSPSTAAHQAPLAINGFRSDVSALLSAFFQKKSHRFERFVEVWEDMNFGYIYGCGTVR